MMNAKGNVLIGLVILLVIVLGGVFLYVDNRSADDNKPAANQKKSESYNPTINPKDFSTTITNKYFSIAPGKKMTFEAQTKDGPEKIEITIEGGTKNIGGVDTVIYRDKVFVADQLVEDTRDYLAQHKNGDVWYFGEDVDNYVKGVFKDHHGTFMHGQKGAKAGIWIKADQKVGDSYRQEYYKGIAEDMRNVVAVDQTVVTKQATYKGCVEFYDWTPLEPSSKEHKYYCPEVAGELVSEHLAEGTRTELVSVVNP